MTEPTDPVRAGSLRFAIVGCGVIGKVHARAISRTAGAALTVTVDLDETAARELADQHGASPALPCAMRSFATTSMPSPSALRAGSMQTWPSRPWQPANTS